MNNTTKRIKHISHNDLDGYACTLLTEFIVESYPEGMFKLETQNIVPNQLHGVIKKTLNEIVNYDLIIITDLAVRQDIVDIIQYSGHSNKFIVIDHHQTNVNISKYPWLNIKIYQDSDTELLTCATMLYYEFLSKDPVFDINLLGLSSTDALDFFIYCVTAHDTKTYNTYKDLVFCENVKDISSRLNSLLHIIDKEEFKSYIKDYIMNEDFGNIKKSIGVINNKNENLHYFYSIESSDIPNYLYLTKSVESYPWLDKIIEIETNRNKRYIENSIKKMIVANLNKSIFKDNKLIPVNYFIGIIFAEKLGSDIAELACKEHPEIDFCAIINYSQVSFYTLKDNINVGELATLLGGGGHRKAAGFTISPNDAQWFNKNHFFAMYNTAANIAIPTK